MFQRVRTAIFTAAGTLAFLTGCGGGGGGSTAGLPDLNAPLAEATAQNGVKAVLSVIDGQVAGSAGGYLPFAAVSGSTVADGDVKAFDATRFMLDKNGPVAKALSYSSSDVLNAALYTYNCDYGGTLTATGTATETHIDATATFDNCSFDVNFTMNGSMRVTMDGTNYGDTVSYMNIYFPADFTMTADSDMYVIHSGSNIETTFTAYAYNGDKTAGTTKSSVQWHDGNGSGRYDGLVVAFTSDFTSSPVMETACYKAGTIYIDNLTASIDIDSAYGCGHPFTYNDYNLVSGSTRLIGANSGLINVNVNATNTITVTDQNGTDINITL